MCFILDKIVVSEYIEEGVEIDPLFEALFWYKTLLLYLSINTCG